jgi:hypothetical protein
LEAGVDGLDSRSTNVGEHQPADAAFASFVCNLQCRGVSTGAARKANGSIPARGLCKHQVGAFCPFWKL